MSILSDVLKSGASSVAGAVSEKLGVDPAAAQGLIDHVLPADQAEAEPAAQDQQDALAEDQADAAPAIENLPQPADQAAEDEGAVSKVTAMLGGSQGITDRARQLLDQDGDGNPLNDVTGMIGKFFAKD